MDNKILLQPIWGMAIVNDYVWFLITMLRSSNLPRVPFALSRPFAMTSLLNPSASAVTAAARAFSRLNTPGSFK